MSCPKKNAPVNRRTEIDEDRLRDAERMMAEHRLSPRQALMYFDVPEEDIPLYEAEMKRRDGR